MIAKLGAAAEWQRILLAASGLKKGIPENSLAITHPINPRIPGIEEIPSGELILYREKAQEFEPRDPTST